MKRATNMIAMLLMCLSLTAGLHSYTEQSVLNEGRWVKMRVSETGVCRISFADLRAAGLDPQQLRVYGYGGAMLAQSFQKPKIDDLPQVPVYVGEDYVLFWVQGSIGWSYSGSRFVHTRNPYSDYGYYFLTDNAGELLAPEYSEEVFGTPVEITSYPYYQVHEYDSINLIDRNGVSGGGREFYGEMVQGNKSRTFSFTTPNAIAGEQSIIYVDVAAYSLEASYFVAQLNGSTSNSVYIKAYSDHYTMGCSGIINMRSTATAEDKQEVKLTLQNSASGAMGWLNYIELTTPSRLQMTGSWMGVRTTVNYLTSVPVRFHLSGANEGIQIWDITNKAAIKRMRATYEDGELQWTGTQYDGIHEYIAVDPKGTKWVSAQLLGEIPNQNLHALRNTDYVIICPSGYETIAEDLAKAHEEKDAVTWAVVTEEQVFNEFSSGTPDATAYRWLMKMLYDRADGANAKPRWLLLMGHGTFDNRRLLANSGARVLLSYQAKNSLNEVNAYATDDYFAFLDDNEGENDTEGTMDIGVGRLPVNNVSEARAVVDKIIGYIHNTQPGKWKTQLIFLADDGEGGTHTETSEEGAELVRVKNPDFVVNKIFLDAYPQEVNASGESYPLAKNRLENLLKNGALFFDYSGHGGYNAITSEAVLTLQEIEAMKNKNLAFWLFVTCNFGQCDSGRRSAAEAAVMNPNGGAVGICTATRTVYASGNTLLNRAICDTLFGHKNVFHYDMTIGEAIAAGKKKLGMDANKMAYVLLGDPAIRLHYPTDYQAETLTKIDTLNALSVQHVKGRIVDEDKLTVSDFDGTVDITVYDKMQVISTRDNDASSENRSAKLMTYNDYPNILFTGSAAVKEGEFEYTFMVPKDIRYNYGNGRIIYYAHTSDSVNLAEAVGHYEDFTIGGTGSILTEDTVGPEMSIYLETPAFIDGGKTYASPRFFAELEDPHGINTAGAGIGHDLLLIVDNDPKMTYSLNEYFTSSNDSYQSGKVSYRMESLSDGQHSLTFRAWDLLNNSTTQSLNFIVDAGLDPSIYRITTYPNPAPAHSVVTLDITYDQPDELLETEVYLYNLSGQVIWSHRQEASERISLNLTEIGVQPGMYVYNVRLKSATSRYSTSSGRIVVTK